MIASCSGICLTISRGHEIAIAYTYFYKSRNFCNIQARAACCTACFLLALRGHRPIVFILILFALLHVYIGARLLLPLALTAAGFGAGVLLLVASTCLVPMGLLSTLFKRHRWSD